MPLTVKIFSFSYLKSGIPKDNTIHGGGFVFDCRYLCNPGRYPEYFILTGKDEAVKKLLEDKEDVKKFIRNVKSIISSAIENYTGRGFESLQISFGCTGGQHRSVYSAEKICTYILENYPDVNVVLNHIELNS
jgi:RNase adaptor protein for sRNA GlmZ degradation